MKFFTTFLLVIGFQFAFGQNYIEKSSSLGITHQYIGSYGGGISFCDFNMDGWDDLTFASGSGDSLLFFENNAGIFTQIYPSGITHMEEAKQVIWVDYDNDGDRDLYVNTYNGSNKLYLNKGNFIFDDHTASTGIPTQSDESYPASFVDFNNDGWLDLYIGNYNSSGYTNQVLLSDKKGAFVNITSFSTIADSTKYTLACSFFDIDNDSKVDLYVANDKINANSMYLNNGNGTFNDISVSSRTNAVIDAMGIAVGDFDQDQFLDFYVTNTAGGNLMFHNNKNSTFSDITPTYGLAVNKFCWGANFLDYDNDGDLDLYVSNSDPSVKGDLFRNDKVMGFTSVTPGFLGDTSMSYCNVIGDLNNDGFSDIAVMNASSNVHIWENSGNSNNWTKVELTGTVSNREGIGSTIEIYAGGLHTITPVLCGTAYLAQNSTSINIGLDTNSIIDSLIIHWPSGHKDKFYNLFANQKINVTEGQQLNLRPELVYDTLAFCSGDSLLISLDRKFKSYSWSNGKDEPEIHATTPGSYYVSVVNEFGFTEESDTIVVDTFLNSLQIEVMAESPSKKGLKDGYAAVTVSGGTPPYEVFWNDDQSQTGDTATLLTDTIYTVIVRDSNGCFRKGLADLTIPIGVDDIKKSTLQIFPSPNTGFFFVKNSNKELTDLKILDISGRLLHSQQSEGKEIIRVDMSNSEPGIYYVILQTNSEVFHGNVIIK